VASRAVDSHLDLANVIAISPVLDPVTTLVALERAIPGYQLYFIRKWMKSLLKKQAAWPQIYDFREIGRLANLRRMTTEMLRRWTEFTSLDEYLNGYSIVGSVLANLQVPAHIITSLDDPIIPARDLPRLARNPSLKLTVTRHGGHCGFLERLNGPSWVEHRVIDELTAAAHGI
jgi:predicted alpha/beta-fold hydrolase